MITQIDFQERVAIQKTSFTSLEEHITHQLEVVQYYINNHVNITVMNLMNNLKTEVHLSMMTVNRPKDNNTEGIWLLGTAYTTILNKFKPTQ